MGTGRELIICGAGGHARSVIDIIMRTDAYRIVGCIDPHYPGTQHVPLLDEIKVIGRDDDLIKFYKSGITNIFIALGDNKLRKNMFEYSLSIGFSVVNIISQHAIISPRAVLGMGVCVMPGAVINVNTVIGDNCIINTRCSLDHDCKVGNHSHIAPGVTISGSVSIEEGVHIGTGSSVIDNIHIGSWAYIGGGAAVVNDINAGVLAYGVPAKEIKKRS